MNQMVPLRSKKSVSFLGNQRQTFKNSAPPPFGYCYLEGRLQKDSREFPVLQIIEKQIYPQILVYKEFLVNTYLPKAREEISLAAMPNGAACYKALLKYARILN